MSKGIDSKTISFLQEVRMNNNRDWFTSNKDKYEFAHQNMIEFADGVLNELSKFDVIETATGKKSLMRIYRDVRFSKDKSPYKSHWGGGFKRATASRRGGFYFHIEPGASFVGGGFWGPNKDDLLHIRKQLDQDADPLREVINSKNFKNVFGELKGEKLKSAPKNFDKDHPNIDLLRYKQFVVSRSFSDAEIRKSDFGSEVAKTFKGMLPFFDVMTEMLTTDLNGESLIQSH